LAFGTELLYTQPPPLVDRIQDSGRFMDEDKAVTPPGVPLSDGRPYRDHYFLFEYSARRSKQFMEGWTTIRTLSRQPI
jgi:hypothetical protein